MLEVGHTCSQVHGHKHSDVTGIYHCTGVEGVKCTADCYFQGRIFNPTNLLNHVAPFIELMMQM